MSVIINASTSSGLIQTADTSGTLVLQSNGTTQFTVASTGSYGQLKSGTAVASTSGTSIDFTALPSWVKRITVLLQGVSTSGTSNQLIQLGTGSTTYTTSGYVGTGGNMQNSGTTNVVSFTTGFGINTAIASYTINGSLVIKNITGNTWIIDGVTGSTTGGGGGATATMMSSSGYVALGAALTAVRITTVNGTDTFDAGSINIMYEG